MISELDDATPATNINYLIAHASGEPLPRFAGGFGAVPDVRFSTPQVATVLTELGLTGADLSGGNTDLLFRRGDNRATRELEAAAVHLRARCVSAFAYIESITAGQDVEALARVRVIPTYVGGVVPLILAGTVAVDSNNAETAEHFTLGPADVDGALGGLIRMELDLQPEPQIVADSGEPFPSFAGLKWSRPRFNFTTRENDDLASLGTAGAALAALTAYLRRLEPDQAGPYAVGQNQHVKFTASAGFKTWTQITGGADDPTEGMIRVDLRQAGSGETALTAQTGQQIT